MKELSHADYEKMVGDIAPEEFVRDFGDGDMEQAIKDWTENWCDGFIPEWLPDALRRYLTANIVPF